MAIILNHPVTPQEIRVLQEFRRLTTETLSLEAIKNIKHPAGGGEAPARGLVGKGYLAVDEAGNFTVTETAKEFLAIEAKPETAAAEEA